MLLQNKNILIYGVRNERSLAWGCAQSASREGARLALTYFGEREEKDVRKLAASLPNADSIVIQPCDLTKEDQVVALHEVLAKEFGTLHAVMHAVAFAKKEDIDGRYVDTSRDGFLLAMESSAFTFVTAAKHAAPADDRRRQYRHTNLPGKRKVRPELQRDGSGQSGPGGIGAVPGV